MVEEKTVSVKRDKPKFFRTDWHKKIKLGSTVKKNRKWKAAKGRQNKIRLGRKGYAQRPKVGWQAAKETKGLIEGVMPVRVENTSDLLKVGKGQGVMVASVGKKKKESILAKASELKLKILNRYRRKK